MKGGGHDPKRKGHDPQLEVTTPPEAGEVSHSAVRVLGGGSLLVSPPPCVEILSELCIWTCRGGIF